MLSSLVVLIVIWLICWLFDTGSKDVFIMGLKLSIQYGTPLLVWYGCWEWFLR